MVYPISVDCFWVDNFMVVLMIYDRKIGKTIEEKVYKSRAMNFLYNTTLGGLCACVLRLPIMSKIYAVFHRDINKHFTRKETRTFEQDKNVLIAPADSCLLVRTIEKGVMFTIKNKDYTLARFLKDEKLAQKYEGGICLIFRLSVYDYHRFCFIDDGVIQSQKHINGFLDSVNTKKTGKFTLSSNYREISQMKTSNFDDIVFAEVGAMLVGRIVNTHKKIEFNKGDEKGYFEFGGSSIVLLLKKDIVKIDEDILTYSSKGIETKVKYGERIGVKHV